ncbi:MAG: PKD domain-containing protein [Bacteroidetes bacterium]|nr:PKD domain-containing protein [Bacteroidota bacterium]
MKYIAIVLLVVLMLPSMAQEPGGWSRSFPDEVILNHVGTDWTVEKDLEIPFGEKTPFTTFSMRIYETHFPHLSVYIAGSTDGQDFEEFKHIEFEKHGSSNSEFRVLSLSYLDPNTTTLRVRITGRGPMTFPIEYHWFRPGTAFTLEQADLPPPAGLTTCELPNYTTRTGWNCPTGQMYSNGSPSFTTVSHMAVHHSAGSNTSDNWAAVALSIWYYHRYTNNWSDIGYNFLIDPNGVIYEGRGGNNGYALDVLPAATCGSNSGTMAVCMLGNYNTVELSPEAAVSLEELLAWKAIDNDIDPVGSSTLNNYGVLNHIFGHRQGCSTECPGDNLYDDLPQIRTNVQSETATMCNEPCLLPMADFTANPLEGPIPLTVQFTNTSTDAQGYEWSFPGGSPLSSTSTDVEVVYNAPGIYPVQLTALNECGPDDTTYAGLINAQLVSGVFDENIITGMYPNPVSTLLHIDFGTMVHKARIELFNTTGQIVHHQIATGHYTEVPMDALAQGLYAIRLTDTHLNRYWIGKVVKD